jgi:hypothetical protein
MTFSARQERCVVLNLGYTTLPHNNDIFEIRLQGPNTLEKVDPDRVSKFGGIHWNSMKFDGFGWV